MSFNFISYFPLTHNTLCFTSFVLRQRLLSLLAVFQLLLCNQEMDLVEHKHFFFVIKKNTYIVGEVFISVVNVYSNVCTGELCEISFLLCLFSTQQLE